MRATEYRAAQARDEAHGMRISEAQSTARREVAALKRMRANFFRAEQAACGAVFGVLVCEMPKEADVVQEVASRRKAQVAQRVGAYLAVRVSLR